MQDEFLFEIDEDGEVTEVQEDSIGDMEGPEHYDNLVDYLKSTVEGQAALADIGRIVVEQTNQEIAARDDWEQTNVKGLDQIGVKMEETSEPFDGACTVTHPLLLESAVKFQAKAIVELFPPGGPTKTQIMGKVDMAKENIANIVKDYMNYLLTEKMEEYFDEEERIYYYSALVGSAFSKVIYSLQMKRPIREFVPATDFIISNDTTSIRTAFGYTHRVRKAEHALLDLIADGVYANVLDDLGEPKLPKLSEFEEKANSLTGIDPTVADSSKCYTLYERHMYYSIPGLEVEKNGIDILVPYIFTVDADTGTVLAVRRNWAEGDPNHVKEEYFTHYPFDVLVIQKDVLHASVAELLPGELAENHIVTRLCPRRIDPIHHCIRCSPRKRANRYHSTHSCKVFAVVNDLIGEQNASLGLLRGSPDPHQDLPAYCRRQILWVNDLVGGGPILALNRIFHFSPHHFPPCP